MSRSRMDLWVHDVTPEKLKELSEQFDRPIKELETHDSVELKIPLTGVTVYWMSGPRSE